MPWIDPVTARTIPHAEAIARMAEARVVLLGEQHDRPEDHRFQELTLAGLAACRSGLEVGFEMFPSQLQPALDTWGQGMMSEAEFLRETGWEKVWGFPPELYLPLFRVCRELLLPMFAMNVERPVVSLVGREGWQALPKEYRSWLTPAEEASAEYRRYLFAVTGGARPERKARSPDDPAFDTFVRAQQVWDRAFACAIATALSRNDSVWAAGIIGRGHLEYRLGVPKQLEALGIGPVIVALPYREVADTIPIADLVFSSVGKTQESAPASEL